MLGYLLILGMSISAFLPSLKAEEIQEADVRMDEEIKHVVVLMLENRSFDNLLGWLYSSADAPRYFIPHDTDPHYLGLSEDTLLQYENVLKDMSGQTIYSCPPIKGVPSVSTGRFLDSPNIDPHETFYYVTRQIFGFDGKMEPTMSGFLQDYATLWGPSRWLDEKSDICAVMETYTDRELPVFYGLSKHYAVSDLWFASVPTQTNPNRAFAACGTSEGQIDNGFAGVSLFYSDTIWNRLVEESPETTWMIFWEADMLPGIVKGPFTGTNTFLDLNRIPNLEDHYQKMDQFHDLARKGQLPDFSFLEPALTLSVNLTTQNAPSQDPECCLNKTLGLQGNDFHPPGDVRGAEDLLSNIYTSLIANPDAWKHTLLIVTFDEHGGLFDHVAPPPSIAPDAHFENGFTFDRYGVRVPAIFISPKIKKSTVIRPDDPTAVFDHTSLIATILKWKKIDKMKWKMGKRVDSAPTFEKVITLSHDREDYILKPDSVFLPKPNPSDVVQIGDKFYLRDQNGNYLTYARTIFSKDKLAISFSGGCGSITHGSFSLIQSHDPSLGNANILGTLLWQLDCVYRDNSHSPGQWWTIKSLDCPYVGAEIQYGDRVYIENSIYLDPFQYVPARLTLTDGFFGKHLTTRPLSDPRSTDSYWIIEKIDN